MKIWDVAIKYPVFMTMVLLSTVVLGLYSFTRMPIQLFPDIEFPVVVVNTVYPGASPEEVEDTVTSVLEEDLASLNGIDDITSISRESLSTIILVFDLDLDVNNASQQAQERLNILRGRLPSDAEDPALQRFNPTQQPIMRLAVADKTGKLTPAELRQFVKDNVQGPIQRVTGVSAAEISGGQIREIQIYLDSLALEARRVSHTQVIGALQSENTNVPGGSLNDGRQEMLIRTPGELQSLADVENVIVNQRNGTPLRLRDVATVVDGFEERSNVTLLNGEESIIINIRKQSGTNTLAVSEGVRTQLEKIGEGFPDLDIVIASDQAEVVERSAEGALDDILWSALFATLVIFCFFQDLRNTFVTMVGLPVIMIGTFFFMDLAGISFNNISLLALALVVGLVIDDGIVVRENILRWIERGYTKVEAASKGTAEVLLPVIATSATILAVFMPVAYAEGIIGQFFRDFGLTVSITIIVSTFEALTLAPMLSAYFFKDSKHVGQIDESRGQELEGRTWLDRFYGRLLGWSLDYWYLTIVIAVVVLFLSVVSARNINTSFVPTLDEGVFDVDMALPQGTPLEVTEVEARKVGQIISSHPMVVDVFTTIGGTNAPEEASFFVKVEKDAQGKTNSRAVIDSLRGPLINVPNVSFRLSEEGPGGGDPFIGNKDVLIETTALNMEYADLGREAQKVLAQISAAIPGLTDGETSYNPGRPETQIKVDRQKASDFGLSTAQIGSTIRTLVTGQTVTTFRGEGTEADIKVQLQESERSDINDVLALSLLSPSGQMVPLRNVATIVPASGPAQIQRAAQQPTVSMGFNVVDRDIPATIAEVTAFLETLSLPPGMEIKPGGDAEIQQESFQNLGLALGLSIVFVYMVLASQFGSFIQPVLIMLAMPLSVIGALMALSISGRPLDLTAFIGFILLMGLVTKNSILLVDFANRERANGATAKEAMRRAGPVRLRPILMTALSLILAMIPVVMAWSAGGEFRQPLGTAVMGGMITSTFLTLFIVPVSYSLVIGFLDRMSARIRQRRGGAADTPVFAEPAPTPPVPPVPPVPPATESVAPASIVPVVIEAAPAGPAEAAPALVASVAEDIEDADVAEIDVTQSENVVHEPVSPTPTPTALAEPAPVVSRAAPRPPQPVPSFEQIPDAAATVAITEEPVQHAKTVPNQAGAAQPQFELKTTKQPKQRRFNNPFNSKRKPPKLPPTTTTGSPQPIGD